MKTTPMQQVKALGGREALVKTLVPVLGNDPVKTKSALMGTTNAKLLRVNEVAQAVQKRFGSRKELIARTIALRYPTGNAADGFVKKMEEATLKRLLEEYRQAGGK